MAKYQSERKHNVPAQDKTQSHRTRRLPSLSAHETLTTNVDQQAPLDGTTAGTTRRPAAVHRPADRQREVHITNHVTRMTMCNALLILCRVPLILFNPVRG